MWDPSFALQISSQAAFYWKVGKLMPFLCIKKKKMLFLLLYLSRHHCTSELYKRLGGTGNLVETFHNSIAPFLVQEASAQKSWRLGTAATAGHSLGGDSAAAPVTGQARADFSASALWQTRVWLSEKYASSLWLIFTHPWKHFQDPQMVKQIDGP